MFMKEIVIKYLFGLEPFYPIDELFIFDDEKNVANIVSVLITEKFDYEEMKTSIYKKAMRYKRFRSKVIKILGRYYFKEMSE